MSTITHPNSSRVRTTTTSIRISINSRLSANFRLITTISSPSLDRAQTTTDLIATTTNNAVASLILTTNVESNPYKIDSATAIGICVAIVVFVIFSAGSGYWMYFLRRGKPRPPGHSWSATTPPSSSNNNKACSSQGRDTFTSSFPEDMKRLVGPGNQNMEREREELPPPTKPTEIACVELMELEGDSGTWGRQTVTVLQRVQRPSTSHSTNTTATTQNPESPPLKLPKHAFLHLDPRYHYERYPDDSRSTHSSMRFDPIDENAASIYRSRESPVRRPSIKNMETNWRHQSYKASMKHNSLESNAVFLAGEGEEEAYMLFRWPELKWQSEASSFR